MVKGAALVAATGLWAATAGSAETVDAARWAATLPRTFFVRGVKSEPTWQEAIEIRRSGDRFVVTGGAPAWADRLTESVTVGPGGALLAPRCAASACALSEPPAGFLATAALVAAEVRGRLRGSLRVLPYGERSIVCVPAETLGVSDPILDPCFDRESGAVLAQRHHNGNGFGGASLDPTGIRVEVQTGRRFRRQPQ